MFIEPWESLVSRAGSPKKEGEVRGVPLKCLKKFTDPVSFLRSLEPLGASQYALRSDKWRRSVVKVDKCD